MQFIHILVFTLCSLNSSLKWFLMNVSDSILGIYGTGLDLVVLIDFQHSLLYAISCVC